MKSTFIILCLALFIMGCKEKSQTISHDDTIETKIKKDSSKIEIADLPILIDSTDYLIHPIGYITEYDNSKFSSYSKGGGHTSYAVSRYNKFSITGEFSTIKFQHLNSEKFTALSDEIMEITAISFLENIRAQTGLQFFVYTIRDADTNKDSKLDFNDIETLYISTIDGKNLKKLTPEFAQIVDWKVIPKQNRLYFKSISDTNKTGEFDKNDKVNYQYVNLENEDLSIINYNPL
ncbi:hypothetical protein DFQ09_10328 [Winogradskyella pacifica]|uniref:Uncharacterized protein n=1 Tax=Winogradskyella pacifica TaxID=664642 RepID=A0A3D9N1J3_9FLAO|nr:hypothetical protein [Winogradskyella pacifica]REE24722.1 hypothetical protein DFQ09_10328 [Winogradskyella pacifica]